MKLNSFQIGSWQSKTGNRSCSFPVSAASATHRKNSPGCKDIANGANVLWGVLLKVDRVNHA
jgi:hypothetical protein